MFHFLNPEKRKKALKLFKYVMKFKIFSLTPDGEIINKKPEGFMQSCHISFGAKSHETL